MILFGFLRECVPPPPPPPPPPSAIDPSRRYLSRYMRTGAYTCIAIPSTPPTLFALAGTAAPLPMQLQPQPPHPPSLRRFPYIFASQPCVRLTREARGNASSPPRHAQRQVRNTATLHTANPHTKIRLHACPPFYRTATPQPLISRIPNHML